MSADAKSESGGKELLSVGRRRLAVTGACFVVGLAIAGCAGKGADAESELRAWVAAAEEEAGDRDRRALLGRVAESYADARGHHREDIDKLLRFYLLRRQNVALLTRIEDIRLSGDSAAEMAVTVAMAGTGGGFDLSADAYRFELELEKYGRDWQLIGAKWGQLGDELL